MVDRLVGVDVAVRQRPPVALLPADAEVELQRTL